MKCAVRRWSPGNQSTPSKQVETEETKQMEKRLQAMKQERAAQDTMWEEESSDPSYQPSSAQETKTSKYTYASVTR